MTAEMHRIVCNVPVVETRGHYVVTTRFGQTAPLVTVHCKDDDLALVNLSIDLARGTMTVVPSLLCRDTDTLWNTVVGLLHECGTCDERNRLVRFDSGASLIRGLDRFLELLETV